MKADRRIGGGSSAPHYRHPLVACITPFLGGLRNVSDPAAKRDVWWTPFRAALAAVLMVVDQGCCLRVRFEEARTCMAGDFKRQRRAGTTYTGLLKALERQAERILPVVKEDLRRQAEARLRWVYRRAKWRLLAVDGSKEDLPRTKDQEKVFGIADNGKFPQALMTIIVEVRTQLLWDWRIDRGRGSEKGHLADMAADLPANALLLGDGNFVGFSVWSQLHNSGKHFLIRVGGNVRLITHLWPGSRTQQQGRLVYVWPKQRQSSSAPLSLRLIQVGRGRQAVYLLTNVLDRARLSVREAGECYRLRWGVELAFRTLKCTLGYSKLRSRTGRRARIELEWAMITLAIMAMMGIDAAMRYRMKPERISPAHLIRTLRAQLLRPSAKSALQQAGDFHGKLVSQVRDTYRRRRPKASRHRPKTTNTPNPVVKPPLIRRATKLERELAKQYQESMVA